MKQHYKFVFCILVYRNTNDLIECIRSIHTKVENSRILIVNSYFDECTKNKAIAISERYDCDFINIENKGYSYGNNQGIEYIEANYFFNYIVISNPDIVVKKFNSSFLDKYKDTVIAPMIKTKAGKSQNPYWTVKCSFAEWLIYNGFKKKNRVVLYCGFAINKIIRELFIYCFMRSHKTEKKVYAAHGSFCLIPSSVIKNHRKLYDENMFLFAEEAYLAHVFEKEKINTILTKNILIFHKEDGSMKLSKINEDDELRKSVMYYYENMDKDSQMNLYGIFK